MYIYNVVHRVNKYLSMNPCMPFGGHKQSGEGLSMLVYSMLKECRYFIK